MSNSQKPICFVICPIGESGSETRKRSDKVLTHVFQSALGEEYQVTRADKISEPGMITSQILRALQDSELVIADLTEHNANVFYELAVRHAAEKPVIHVIDTRWKIPFDVAGFRTVMFDFTDLDSVADAIKQLKQQASDIKSGKLTETPIKLANVLRRTTSDSQDTVLLKEAVQSISNVHSTLTELTSLVNKLQSENFILSSVPTPNLLGVNAVAQPFYSGSDFVLGKWGAGKSGGFVSYGQSVQPDVAKAGSSQPAATSSAAEPGEEPNSGSTTRVEANSRRARRRSASKTAAKTKKPKIQFTS